MGERKLTPLSSATTAVVDGECDVTATWTDVPP
jgi:hypothetical protein